MRVAVFLPSLQGGGAERVMLHLARGFAERGYDVDLVLAKCKSQCLPEIQNNINVVDLNAGGVLGSLPALIRYLRSARPATLLSAMDHANIVALWARKLSRVQTRIIVSVHNTLSISLKYSNSRARLIPIIAKQCYGWANGVVAVSKGVAENLSHTVKLPSDSIHVIYNPVVVPELFQMAESSLDHPWFQDGDTPVVLSAGRLCAQKDYATLLRAFSLLVKTRPARLLILGEGKDRASLEAMVRDLGLAETVDLPGYVKNPYAYMSKAAVFTLSSAWEGFGNVLVEAMAVGTPVVATDCPSGPAEILDNGKYGRLVKTGDAEALAQGILAELDSPTSQEVLQQRAREFSYDRITDQYLKLLNSDY